MEPLLLPIHKAIVYAGFSRSYLYERLSEGSIQSVKAGRRTLVVVASLKSYIEAMPKATFRQSTVAKGG